MEEVIVSELADVSDDDTDEEDGNTEGAFNKIFVEKARNRDDDPDESTTDMAIKIVMDLGGSNCHPAFQERLPWLLTFFFLIFWVGFSFFQSQPHRPSHPESCRSHKVCQTVVDSSGSSSLFLAFSTNILLRAQKQLLPPRSITILT